MAESKRHSPIPSCVALVWRKIKVPAIVVKRKFDNLPLRTAYACFVIAILFVSHYLRLLSCLRHKSFRLLQSFPFWLLFLWLFSASVYARRTIPTTATDVYDSRLVLYDIRQNVPLVDDFISFCSESHVFIDDQSTTLAERYGWMNIRTGSYLLVELGRGFWWSGNWRKQ